MQGKNDTRQKKEGGKVKTKKAAQYWAFVLVILIVLNVIILNKYLLIFIEFVLMIVGYYYAEKIKKTVDQVSKPR